jgi:uncharacterized damage-inducible protein DinB
MQTVESLLQLHRETHRCLELLLRHCAPFTAEELAREFEGFGFPSLRSQLTHIIECEDFWLAKLKQPGGGPLPYAWCEGEPADSIEQIEQLRQRIQSATAAHLEELGDSRLNDPLELRWPEAPDAVEVRTPAFLLLHVMTHAFHHKGQAVAICRLLGRPAPDTDIQRPET